MNKISLSICVILSTNIICGGQSISSEALKDSVYNKYVKNGAYNYSYLSQEWQKYIDTAISITPDNAYLWQQKAMPYFKRQKYEVGMKYLDKAVELSPVKYTDYRAFMKCIFTKNYTDAITDFMKAKELKEGAFVMDHSYDFYLGLCYLQLNNFIDAKKYFQLSINQSTKKNGAEYVHFLDWFYLGITQYELEDFSFAISSFDKTLATYKNFADAKYYKSKCLKKMNQIEEADSLKKEAAIDLQAGHTFIEDNSYYEKYPYQISNWYFPNTK